MVTMKSTQQAAVGFQNQRIEHIWATSLAVHLQSQQPKNIMTKLMVASTAAKPAIRVKEVYMSDLPNASFRIKTASFELEYTGSEKFLLEKLRQVTSELAKVSFNGKLTKETLNNAIQGAETSSNSIRENLSTHAIARLLNAKSGIEVTIAAMAKLYFVDKQLDADRGAILIAMREAKPIFKETMASNLTKSIAKLLKDGLLVKLKGERLSLSDEEIQRLERILVDDA